MSLVSSRVALIHRTTVLRKSGEKNGWGHDKKSDDDYSPHIEDLACRGWVFQSRQVIEDTPASAASRAVAVVEDRRVIVKESTDVRVGDRIGDISYRGRMFVDGPMDVTALIHRDGYLELALRRVSG